jgi:hypothetical protein
MTYEVRLSGYTPPARFPPDNALFVMARIEEAPDVGGAPGAWAIIEPAFALSPPVTDPARPPTYDFTTTGATLSSGWYRVVWIDALAVEEPTEPFPLGPKPSFAPTVGEVGGLLHARTTQRGGGEAGTFTSTSRPTADQVEGMIRQASSLVLASTGAMPTPADCPDAPNIVSAVRTLIAMRATLFIEPSLWPEQTVAGVSPYTAMREQYEAELPRVVDAIRDCRESGEVEPGEGGAAGGGGPADASYWFPPGAGYDVVVW